MPIQPRLPRSGRGCRDRALRSPRRHHAIARDRRLRRPVLELLPIRWLPRFLHLVSARRWPVGVARRESSLWGTCHARPALPAQPLLPLAGSLYLLQAFKEAFRAWAWRGRQPAASTATAAVAAAARWQCGAAAGVDGPGVGLHPGKSLLTRTPGLAWQYGTCCCVRAAPNCLALPARG